MSIIASIWLSFHWLNRILNFESRISDIECGISYFKSRMILLDFRRIFCSPNSWYSTQKTIISEIYYFLFISLLSWGRRRRGLVILVFMTTYGNSAYHHERFESQYQSWRAELDTTLCDIDCQWLATGQCFFFGFLHQAKKLTAMI